MNLKLSKRGTGICLLTPKYGNVLNQTRITEKGSPGWELHCCGNPINRYLEGNIKTRITLEQQGSGLGSKATEGHTLMTHFRQLLDKVQSCISWWADACPVI